jgi:hypothetical protein
VKWRAMIETFLTVEASSEEEAQAAAKAALITRLNTEPEPFIVWEKSEKER